MAAEVEARERGEVVAAGSTSRAARSTSRAVWRSGSSHLVFIGGGSSLFLPARAWRSSLAWWPLADLARRPAMLPPSRTPPDLAHAPHRRAAGHLPCTFSSANVLREEEKAPIDLHHALLCSSVASLRDVMVGVGLGDGPIWSPNCGGGGKHGVLCGSDDRPWAGATVSCYSRFSGAQQGEVLCWPGGWDASAGHTIGEKGEGDEEEDVKVEDDKS
ncbi:unnamed protein product [Urochloa humidicola]